MDFESQLHDIINQTIINQAVSEYENAEIIDHTFSDSFNQRMNSLIKDQRKFYYPLIKTTFRRVITIFAAAIIVGSITVGAVPELRRWFIGLFVTENDRNSDIKFVNGEIDSSMLSVSQKLVSPAYVPSGFSISDEFCDESTHIITYKSGNKTIEFTQEDISAGFNIDTEDAETETISVGNFSGYISIFEDTTILVWSDNNFSYSIIGDLCKSDIIAMANSVISTK